MLPRSLPLLAVVFVYGHSAGSALALRAAAAALNIAKLVLADPLYARHGGNDDSRRKARRAEVWPASPAERRPKRADEFSGAGQSYAIRTAEEPGSRLTGARTKITTEDQHQLIARLAIGSNGTPGPRNRLVPSRSHRGQGPLRGHLTSLSNHPRLPWMRVTRLP